MTDLDSRLSRIRDRFLAAEEPEPENPTTWARCRAIGRFILLSTRKADEDELLNRSSSLAFITVVSLVPLLAALSHFSAGFFADRQEQMIELLSMVLPYTEATLNSNLSEFLEQSKKLQGFGLVAFFFTALTAFSMIEKSINDIWDVSHRRSLRNRINSFILLLCWGPLLIGAAYSILFLLRQSPTLAPLADSLPVQWATFAITLIGLSMLNWQVPNTDVQFRSALLGGACSAISIEALRRGFAFYVEQAQSTSLVYGSFGFVLLFMISIQLSWVIVLAGSELAYCMQNFRFMSRPRRETATVEGGWIGIAAMVLIMDRFRRHCPFTPGEYLAERLNISTVELNKMLQPLLQAEYLQEHGPDAGGYLMSCDPYRVPLVELFEAYESQQWSILSRLPEDASVHLTELRARLVEARKTSLEGLTLAQLMDPGTEESPPGPKSSSKTAPA